MSAFEKTDRTSITRLPKRGAYDKETIYAILDEALFCTVAYVHEGQPFQIPTGFCRIGDSIYLHGSVGSFYMRALAEKNPEVCVSATLIDGLVLARSGFHHSVNYRSVVLFGKAVRVTANDELYQSLEVLTNKMQPGRWNDLRPPNDGEWKATMAIRIAIDEASAKMRTGGPIDDEQDYERDTWAGVVPLKLERGIPIPDSRLKPNIPLPPYLLAYGIHDQRSPGVQRLG